MFTPPPNDEPERLLAYHAEGLRALHAALDDGISFADGLVHNGRWDAHFWSNAARYHAKTKLLEYERTSTTWKMGRELNNGGIEIVRDLQVLRLLRQEGGQTPSPGRNRARRAYYQQTLPLTFTRAGVDVPPAATLIVEWNANQARDLTMALTKTKGVWRYRERPVLAWRRTVTFGDGDDLRFVPPSEEELTLEGANYNEDDLQEGEAG